MCPSASAVASPLYSALSHFWFAINNLLKVITLFDLDFGLIVVYDHLLFEGCDTVIQI